jgi:hypothetical protein
MRPAGEEPCGIVLRRRSSRRGLEQLAKKEKMLVAQSANRAEESDSNWIHSYYWHTTFGGKTETKMRAAARSRTTTNQKPNLETQTVVNNGRIVPSIAHQDDRTGRWSQITPSLEGIFNKKK